MRKVANSYSIRWCIYNLFSELSKGGSNSQQLMLTFHKENNASWKNHFQGILPIFMLAYLVIIYSFCAWWLNGRYGRHYMADFPVLYWTITRCKLPPIMLALLSILQKINIHRCRENSQHSMLVHPDFNKIWIDTYKNKISNINVCRWWIYNLFIE